MGYGQTVDLPEDGARPPLSPRHRVCKGRRVTLGDLQSCSGAMRMKAVGHSLAQMPHPLQKAMSKT